MEKQFMHRVSRLLPSSLASCHFRNVPDVIDSSILITRSSQVPKPNTLPDSFNASIITPQPKPKPKPQVSGVNSVSIVTNKNSSSSNNSGWFSSEQEEEQHQEAFIDPETETMFSLSYISSTSSSSESSLLNPDSCRKTSENKGRSCDHTVMGYSPSDGSSEFSRITARKSLRKSSASSCNLYYSDLGSFRSEAIQTRRESGHDKVLGCCSFVKSGGGAAESSGEFSRKNTQKPHRQTTKSGPRSEESFEVSSTISTGLGSFRRKTSNKNSCQRSTKKLSDGEVSSMSTSTHLYYSDSGSFRREETTNTRRKTRRSVSKKKLSYGKVGESYAVEKSSRDPFNDFRISMVEMIVEKQIFREEELGKLLECFLSLNTSDHHETIFKVFLEVCTNLFTQSSYVL